MLVMKEITNTRDINKDMKLFDNLLEIQIQQI